MFKAIKSVKKQYDLTNKVCVITGGAGFLGRQFTSAILEMGGLPILIDVDENSLKEATEQIGSDENRIHSIVVDITDEKQIASAVGKIKSEFNSIDVLINNAALTKYGCDADHEAFFAEFEHTNDEVWEQGIKINLTATMLCCKNFGSVMVKQRKGSIINIGSDVGVISPDQTIYQPDDDYNGVPFNTPVFYSVSKAGVIHLTKHLATLWAKYNVRVNSFSPAGVYRDHDPEFVKKLSSRIPMGRMASINEYKGAIIFLASDASSFMTGHNLIMDGGRTIW